MCGIKKSCSDPAGPDVERDGIGEDAHVVVMVEDGTISVPMRIQWTDIWGKKAGNIFISSKEVSAASTTLGAFLPAFPIPAEIRVLSNLSCVI